jgi:polyisoprenoid-binding protein YceI
MKATFFQKILLVFLFSSIACVASAEWQLDNEASSIHFVSIKKSKVAEIHHFRTMEGVLNKNGGASVNITLSSVETKIPIRDDRMKSMLFEVDLFPQATVSTEVDISQINQMKPGDNVHQEVKLSLSLHGQEKVLDAHLQVTRLSKDRLMITTIDPLIVNADDFALGKGVEALRTVAKLSSISTAVPVTVNLIFKK